MVSTINSNDAKVAPVTGNCMIAYKPNPSGAPSNFVNPLQFSTYDIFVGSILIALAATFVGLRFVDTLKKKRLLHIDDYLCLVSLCFVISYILLQIQIDKGLSHTWDTPLCKFRDQAYHRMRYATLFIYYIALFTSKSAICFMYLRLFGSKPYLRYTVYAVMLVLGIGCIIGEALAIAMLAKDAGNRILEDHVPATVDLRQWLVVLSGIVLGTDLTLLILPISPILELKISTKKKIGLFAVFSTAFGTTIATCFNLYFRVQTNLRLHTLPDPFWTGWLTDLTTYLELAVTVILSCIPGCVTAWRNMIRDTPFISHLRQSFSVHRDSIARQDSYLEADEKKLDLGGKSGRQFSTVSEDDHKAYRVPDAGRGSKTTSRSDTAMV